MYCMWVLCLGGVLGSGIDNMEQDIKKEESGIELVEEEFLIDDINNDTDTRSGVLYREPYRNISSYPVCVTDDDCADISQASRSDYRCFQYMCYPWESTEGLFRPCKRRSDCSDLPAEEGGDGEDGDCYRHHDRRNVVSGICLHNSEIQPCYQHRDCPDTLRCTNNYCGEQHYYQALTSIECHQDYFCQVQNITFMIIKH